ncbi:MAG TPA: CAP domain-containing protein [Actinomycetota bacterium]|nr:CAP domain-containing protein [Actinomycetota bacterium]
MTQPIRLRRSSIAAVLLACSLLLSTVVANRAEAGVVARDRAEMLELTNASREKNDLRPLKIDTDLSRYARRHSRAMANQDRLFHTSDLALKLRGKRWSVAGENVGYGSSLAQIQRAFMRSKPHRANILKGAYEHAAIGVVRSNGTFWVTVIFYG